MTKKPKRRKKKKRERVTKQQAGGLTGEDSGDEVDAAVREVNRMLGEVGRLGGQQTVTESSPVPHSLLKVDRRYIPHEVDFAYIHVICTYKLACNMQYNVQWLVRPAQRFLAYSSEYTLSLVTEVLYIE